MRCRRLPSKGKSLPSPGFACPRDRSPDSWFDDATSGVDPAFAGYTGLRLDDFRGFGSLLPVIHLPKLSIPLYGNGNPVISFLGERGTP